MTQPKTRQVRVAPDVADMADQLATLLRESTPDMLTRLLRPLLKRELEKQMDRRMKELKAQQE